MVSTLSVLRDSRFAHRGISLDIWKGKKYTILGKGRVRVG